MVSILTTTFIPYEFESKRDGLNYVKCRAQEIHKSIRRIEMENGQLTVRCPLSGDYLVITSDDPYEVVWIDEQLRKGQWYRD